MPRSTNIGDKLMNESEAIALATSKRFTSSSGTIPDFATRESPGW